MKRVLEILFYVECYEADMVWELQHGTPAGFVSAKENWTKEIRKLAKHIFSCPVEIMN